MNWTPRNLSIVGFLLGVVLLVVGVAVGSICGSSFYGFCESYPHAGVGAAIALGGIFLMLGAAFLFLYESDRRTRTPPIVYVPAMPPLFSSPPAPAPSAGPLYICQRCRGMTQAPATKCAHCGGPF